MRVTVEQSLINHRKTKALMRVLKLHNQSAAIGHVVALWAWCMDNAPTGDLSGIDVRDIAAGALWSEDPNVFWQALIYSGFIDDDGKVHHWGHYSGAALDRMVSDRRRKKTRCDPPYRNLTGSNITRNGDNGYHQGELTENGLTNRADSLFSSGKQINATENGISRKNGSNVRPESFPDTHISLDRNPLTNDESDTTAINKVDITALTDDENHQGGDNADNGYNEGEPQSLAMLYIPNSDGKYPHIYNRRIDNTVSNTDNVLSIDNIYINKSGEIPVENGINSNANNWQTDSEFDTFFTVFWRIYPPRNGKKLEKARCQAWLLKNIKASERQTLLKAVRNYATIAGSYPKDPIRFLQGHFWREYIEPGDPDTTKAQTRPRLRDPAPALDPDKYKTGKYAHLFGGGDLDNEQ